MCRGKYLNSLLQDIVNERLKNTDSDLGLLATKLTPDGASEGFWTSIFYSAFLSINQPQLMDYASRDDLIFFVGKSKRHVKPNLRVARRTSPNLPILGDPLINWEETVYLNLIVQCFVYVVTLGVCTRSGAQEIEILKKHSQQVYASPSYRPMDSKGKQETIVYPHVVFPIDDFDNAFSDCVLRDSECLCIEMAAYDRFGALQGVLFEAVVRYSTLKKAHDVQLSGTSSWRLAPSENCNGPPPSVFLRVLAPRSEGIAEVAVQQTDKARPDSSAAAGCSLSSFHRGSTIPNDGNENNFPVLTPRLRPGQKRSSTGSVAGFFSAFTSPLHHAKHCTSDARLPSAEFLAVSSDNGTAEQSKISQLVSGGGGVSSQGRAFTPTSATAACRRFGQYRKARSDSDNLNHATERFWHKKRCFEVEASTFEDEFDGVPFSPPPTSEAEIDSTAERYEAFGQAWQWFKERRRITSMPIKSAITYISIPCHLIISGILEAKNTPVLTSTFLKNI